MSLHSVQPVKPAETSFKVSGIKLSKVPSVYIQPTNSLVAVNCPTITSLVEKQTPVIDESVQAVYM